MKVIGAGFGRTGTLSLKKALEDLGFGPCYHMHELFRHPEHAADWLAAAAGKPVDWNEVFAGYEAMVDEPSASFYAQLVETYPDALVLLDVRDAESWYESCLKAVYPASAAEAGSEWATSGDPVALVINTVIWEGAFTDKRRAIAVYKRHIQ